MKPPVSIAPRYNPNTRNNDASSNNFGANNVNVIAAPSPVQTNFERISIIEQQQQVDSALQSALTDPRERMAVFQMENMIMAFVKSK
jgi:hypothetical protein